jgi:hypothetical protein
VETERDGDGEREGERDGEREGESNCINIIEILFTSFILTILSLSPSLFLSLSMSLFLSLSVSGFAGEREYSLNICIITSTNTTTLSPIIPLSLPLSFPLNKLLSLSPLLPCLRREREEAGSVGKGEDDGT